MSIWLLGHTPITVYLDLSKAFDTLDHSILINKLKYYGIQGCALDLIKKYLSNKQQCVEINNNKSSFINLSTRVPQGSILRPFFNFATNATVHNYSTRGYHQIRNSLVKHDFSCKCIRYSLPILINMTPIIILG